MKKINLAITGCLGRMGQQLVKSSKSAKNFKLVSVTENRIINKKISGLRPQLNSKSAFENDNMHFNAYGLGWSLSDYHGYKLANHGGGILGMVSKVVLVPEADLGLVILTNQQSGYAFNAIYLQILNEYLELAEKDWVVYYHDKQQDRKAKEKVRLAKAADAVDSPVILQGSAGARSYAGEPFLRHLILAAIEEYPHIPVVMHQDHGSAPAVCARSIQSGFSSVMMDGSLMADMKTPSSFEYNVG